MAKLVYVVDWLPPDYGAIGQYALQESEERASAGDHVVLVGLAQERFAVERRKLGAGFLEVIRLHMPAVDKQDFRRRALWTLRTDLRLVARALSEMRGADELLITASPPFLEHLLVPLQGLLPGKLTFRIADLHPECLMNELQRVPGWLTAFQRLTVFWRQHAHSIEVLGEDQRRRLIGQGVAPERITLRRSVSPVRFDEQTRPRERPVELKDRIVLLYSGAVAHAHDIDTFVEGYRLHHQRGPGKVGLWLNASGPRADAFEAAVRAHGLPVHRSTSVPLDELASLLVTPDAHLITLKCAYTGLVVPSKVYGCIASGRPIVFVGSTESDVHLLCRREASPGAFFHANPGAPVEVEGALDSLVRAVQPSQTG
jgi:hypothetical protein